MPLSHGQEASELTVVLLALSTRDVFLETWLSILGQMLSFLKHKQREYQLVAAASVYRLVGPPTPLTAALGLPDARQRREHGHH